MWRATDPRAFKTAERRTLRSSAETAPPSEIPSETSFGALAKRVLDPSSYALPQSTLRFGYVRNQDTLKTAVGHITRQLKRSDAARIKIEQDLGQGIDINDPEQMMTHLESMLKLHVDALDLDGIAAKTDLTRNEFQILSYVLDKVREGPRSSRRGRRPESPMQCYSMPALVQMFHLPASIVRMAIEGLFVKMMAYALTSDPIA